ncbi:MAG: DUF4962 domain-containing protein [Opitutaceae bacterium]|nr:DUF4962 domain-containing protein [Verrucomicrobiales bacterium]
MNILPNKLLVAIVLCLSSLIAVGHTETVKDLKQWTIEGSVQMDPSKPGPGGGSSFKVEPKSKAILKLRDTDGSGKVSMFVLDDGLVANPNKTKSVGPRWGMTSADGRILAGATMYGPKLHPEGSTSLIDTDPSQKNAWLTFKFLSPRGTAGWKKWEFDYNPETGLALTVDGKPVVKKYFDWNYSKAAGFNGLVLYGDETEGTPQTIWVSEITYELGPPMKVKPGSLPTPTPPPPAAAKGPAPEEETEKSSEPPILGKMTGFVPGGTLLEDLRNLKVPLVQDYAARHPRLVFSADDRAALQKKASEHPKLWDRVLANAKRIKTAESVPDAPAIRSGAKYWRIEQVESAALAWFVTGEKDYRDGAIRWMIAHCKERIWGDAYRPNLDLQASWYLYHLSISYDILKSELNDEDRKLISDGLAEHARAIYLGLDPHDAKEKIRYDQNHTYIPTIALAAAALALLEDAPDAKFWLTRSYGVLRRCRYVLSEDGYYYEGFGYWTYALHWHVRGAELLQRATGEKLFDLPALRDTWRFGQYLSLPGSPRAFDIGDVGGWKEGIRADNQTTNTSMLWKVAAETGSGESRLTGDLYENLQPEVVYPASAFLWFAPEVKPKPIDQIPPYHHFPDHDVIAWRSSWKDDAACYLFRCGPPLGHNATPKFGQLKDWMMNGGHVHPDIGAFWMYAKGAYLAVGTGYTAEKWTRDHNTLLIDGKGQGADGTYWNERGIPYEDLNQARIEGQFLSPKYGFASGEFGKTYKRQIPGVELRRSLLMTERWLLVVDDLKAETERKLTWICHSDAPFEPEGSAFIARQQNASLAVIPLGPVKLDAKPDQTTVMAGKVPGKGTPEKRNFHLALTSAAPSETIRFVSLLIPLGASEKLPEVGPIKDENNVISLVLEWPNGKTEEVQVNLSWKSSAEMTSMNAGPAVIKGL